MALEEKIKLKERLKNLGICLAVIAGYGALRESNISNEFIRGNVSDAMYPITNYFICKTLMFRDDLYSFHKPSLALAGTFVLLGSIAEVFQYFHLYHGTYDPKDFPMYIAGGLMAYGLDKAITKRDVKTNLEQRINI